MNPRNCSCVQERFAFGALEKLGRAALRLMSSIWQGAFLSAGSFSAMSTSRNGGGSRGAPLRPSEAAGPPAADSRLHRES